MTMQVPTGDLAFLDLARVHAGRHDELRAAFDEVLQSGCFLNGPQLEEFEAALATRCGARYAIGCGSGTHALQILLLAHGIGPGDEVVTTPASFYSTAKAIELVGATPVFADIDPGDYNLDPAACGAALTPRSRAILVVHLYGRPVALDAFTALARNAGVLLLEDAAHALGAFSRGAPVGAGSDGAAFSFYPTKNLGALGDAGAVVVNDPEVARRARSARFLGWNGDERDVFDHPGISGRMDEVQAAMLRVRLRHFDAEQATRARLAATYRAALPPELLLPPPPPGVTDAHHLFVVRHPQRDALRAGLAQRGIATQVHYGRPLHRQPGRPAGTRLPVAEAWAREVLSLPFDSGLTGAEVEQVADAVSSICATTLPVTAGG